MKLHCIIKLKSIGIVPVLTYIAKTLTIKTKTQLELERTQRATV